MSKPTTDLTSDPATKVVAVTGGSRGLGAGIVDQLLADGWHVAVCARSRTRRVDEWAAHPDYAGRLLFVAADLSQRADADAYVKAVVDYWGRLDALINNAGVARDGVLALTSDEDIDTVIDLNLKGTIYVTRAAVRRMLLAGHGNIVNISSVVGRSGYRGLSVYSATKAALEGFTRGLARELGSRGVRVNAIAPGYLRTEMSHGLDEAQLSQIARRTPVGRLGEPDDISSAIRFLIGPDSGFMTGQVMVLDGGLTA